MQRSLFSLPYFLRLWLFVVITAPSCNAGGFLEEQIPLEIVSTTPAAFLEGGVIEVYGKQTLTVVYSRPVIALGTGFGKKDMPEEIVPFWLEPKVDGYMRWVTTSIARFDTDGDWPYDLDVKIIWNTNLTTYDGVMLTLPEVGEAHFVTQSNQMYLRTIVSQSANDFTDYTWNPELGLEDDILPECPYDCVMELHFDAPVRLTALENHLKVLRVISDQKSSKTEQTALVVQALPCETDLAVEASYESTCANISIANGFLEDNTKYELKMEVGVEYSSKNGPLRKEMMVHFGGLRRFRVPLQSWDNYYVDSHYLDIWLPHGLAPEMLNERFPIFIEHNKTGKQIQFRTQWINRAKLRLFPTLEPGESYKVYTKDSESILDGYGQPLIGTSTSIKMAKINSKFEPMIVDFYAVSGIFEKGQDWGSKLVVFTKGNEDKTTCNALDLFAVTDMEALIISRVSRYKFFDDSLSTIFGDPAKTVKPSYNDVSGTVSKFSLRDLMSLSGVVVYERCKSKNNDFKNFFMVETEWMVQILTYSTEENSLAQAFVSDMTSGQPVSGVNVSFYKGHYPPDLSYEQFGNTVETDLDGMATIVVSSTPKINFGGMLVVLQRGDQFLFVDEVYSHGINRPNKIGKLILDRALLQPKETLHIKGYVRSASGAKLTVPEYREGYRVIIITGDIIEIPVNVSKPFGSFELDFHLPEGNIYGDISVALLEDDEFITDEEFIIAVPRKPSVTMEVSSSKWAPPNGIATVNVITTSFVGTSVGGEEITVKWTLKFETGTETVVTNSKGHAEFHLDLSTLEKTPSSGDSVSFDVQWIGPTGELIEEYTRTTIAYADLLISIERSVDTDLPFQPFGFWIEVTDVNGDALPNACEYGPAFLYMKRPPENATYTSTSDQALLDPLIEECIYEIESEITCQFFLPSMGKYVLEACVKVNGTIICERKSVGRSEDDWIDNPLRDFVPIGIRKDSRSSYKKGDHMNVNIENPYVNAHAMISWGNAEGMEHSVERLPDDQRVLIAFKMKNKCKMGCTFDIVVAIPRQSTDFSKYLAVPISKSHDPFMPHSAYWSTSIFVEDDGDDVIGIRIKFLDAEKDGNLPIYAPATKNKLKIKLDVKDKTEVTVMIVEKAVLELVDNPLVDLTDSFKVDLQIDANHATSADVLIPPNAIRTLIDNFNEKKSLNPWFEIYSDLKLKYGAEELDISSEEYIDRDAWDLTQRSHFTYLTKTIIGYGEASSSTTMTYSVSRKGEDDVRNEKDFKPNLLFFTGVTKNGKLMVPFETADNLGTFVVRVYAASKDGRFGSKEKEFIVRRRVSLTPSIPRFVRVGDKFEAGAVVSVTESGRRKVEVIATVEGPVKLRGEDILEVDVGSDGQEEVRFRFRAKETGLANLTFTAWDKDGNRDAVQVSISIEEVQEMVTLGTSFALDASETSSGTAKEAVDLPDAVPETGSIGITVGLGNQPAILDYAESLYQSEPESPCSVSYDFFLGEAVIPAILDPYSPWDREDEAELLKTVIANFEKAVEALKEGKQTFTRVPGGLQYSIPCLDEKETVQVTRSIDTNARGVWMMEELEMQFKENEIETVRQGYATLQASVEIWRSELETACLRKAEKSREKQGIPLLIDSVVKCRSGLGAERIPPFDTEQQIVKDLSMERLGDAFDDMDLESQALYVLILLKFNPDHPDIDKAIYQWNDLFKVTARTAYITQDQKTGFPASPMAQAFILMALTRAGEDSVFIPKLAAYIASPSDETHGFIRGINSYDIAVSMLSLLVYDIAQGNPDAEAYIKVKSGHVPLLEAALDQDHPGPVVNSTSWEDLDDSDIVRFKTKGSGEASFALTMDFIPSELLGFPTYQGIFVTRVIRLDGDDDATGSLVVVPQGKVVVVEIQFMTPDTLSAVDVRVLMPAGLEPVDPRVFGGYSFYCPVPYYSFYSYGSCPSQETEPKVVSFHYSSLNAGTHFLSFRAVAVTVGKFALPPVHVFATEQPEVMGLSSAGTFEVCEGNDCKAAFDAHVVKPKECPHDCHGNGSCNIRHGTCTCFPGFRGKTCGKTDEN